MMTRSFLVHAAVVGVALAAAGAAPSAAGRAQAAPAALVSAAGSPGAAPDSAKARPRPAPAKAAAAVPDVSILRETFQYAAEGRRDPFMSLLNSKDLRPMISDLTLSVVLYHPGGDSKAVLRDVTSNEQYRVSVGQQLGRMRVARITPKAVTFTILEFGESRQETLALSDSTTTTKKTVRTP
jgi:hypothetical protein